MSGILAETGFINCENTELLWNTRIPVQQKILGRRWFRFFEMYDITATAGFIDILLTFPTFLENVLFERKSLNSATKNSHKEQIVWNKVNILFVDTSKSSLRTCCFATNVLNQLILKKNKNKNHPYTSSKTSILSQKKVD